MNRQKLHDVLGKQDFGFSAGAEITAAGLMFSEICKLPSEKRRCYMEQFITVDDGEMKVDYEILLRELYRIADETCNKLAEMEKTAGTGKERQWIAEARARLSKVNFASLKIGKNPDLMRFLAELYQIL